jgi:hypothetical protein
MDCSGLEIYPEMTPKTKASPTPIGNAMAMPAISITVTSKTLDKLKITPDNKA